jgi:acyl-CoA thioesterase
MTLDDMLAGAARGETTIAPGWGQGRATYGGLVAGLLLARAEVVCARPERRLRSAGVVFVGPVAPGPAAVRARVVREGTSASQVQAEVVQRGETRATLLATFAAPRTSRIAVDAASRDPRPQIPEPAALPRLELVPGVTPDFFAHVDLRFAGAALPFSGADEPDFGGWMRFSRPPATFGVRELIALADAWPPSVLPMLERPSPMSTLAWTFEPVAWPEAARSDAADAYWQYDVHTHAAADGYAQTTARIWDAAGRLRALSHQTIAYFA